MKAVIIDESLHPKLDSAGGTWIDCSTCTSVAHRKCWGEYFGSKTSTASRFGE